MSEYDLFIDSIPYIAEIVVECRKMCSTRYEEWKEQWKREIRKSGLVLVIKEGGGIFGNGWMD